MKECDLYTNTVIEKLVTPYKKLRLYKHLSLNLVADTLCISRGSLVNYESGHHNVPKDIVIKLDTLYGCKGQLIDYWLWADIKKAMSAGTDTAFR